MSNLLKYKSIWQSPAKLNLFLHIINKRPDGYHNLETIFQLLDYADILRFKVNTIGNIVRTKGNEDIPAAQDLIIKSATLLQSYTNCAFGVEIEIDKKIPIGGGLGGGSSNAATVLLALNELWQINLPLDELKFLGRQLGADVPVFLHNHSAWASGIGDKLTSLELPETYFLVINPNINSKTRQVFAHQALANSPKLSKIPSFFQLGATRNDCLAASLALYPEMKKIFDWFEALLVTIPHWQTSLIKGLEYPRLSGTGASVFVGAKDKNVLAQALQLCPSNWHGFIAQGVNKINTKLK